MSFGLVDDSDSVDTLEPEFNTFNDAPEETETRDVIVTSDSRTSTNDRTTTTNEYETNENDSTLNRSSNRIQPSLSILSDDNNVITIDNTDNTSSDEYLTTSSTGTQNKRKESSSTARKLTPIEARSIQRNLKRKKKKSIAKYKTNNSMSHLTAMDEDDRTLMVETTNAKMMFERQRHTDMKTIESAKLVIEKERLKMDRDNMNMKMQQIMAQTSVEKSRMVLLRLDIFKSREGIKKEYPEVTEEYLNTHFPYPE